jgi:hypothetical protein
LIHELATIGALAAYTDPEYESRIQAALADVASSTHKNITVAAIAHNVRGNFRVPAHQ